MQAFTYFQRFPNDLHAYKALVRPVERYTWFHIGLHRMLGSIVVVRKGQNLVNKFVNLIRLLELFDQILIGHAAYTYVIS